MWADELEEQQEGQGPRKRSPLKNPTEYGKMLQDAFSLVEEAGSLARLKQNLTVFVPTNAAVEEFHQNLMAFNTLDNEVSQ